MARVRCRFIQISTHKLDSGALNQRCLNVSTRFITDQVRIMKNSGYRYSIEVSGSVSIFDPRLELEYDPIALLEQVSTMNDVYIAQYYTRSYMED